MQFFSVVSTEARPEVKTWCDANGSSPFAGLEKQANGHIQTNCPTALSLLAVYKGTSRSVRNTVLANVAFGRLALQRYCPLQDELFHPLSRPLVRDRHPQLNPSQL